MIVFRNDNLIQAACRNIQNKALIIDLEVAWLLRYIVSGTVTSLCWIVNLLLVLKTSQLTKNGSSHQGNAAALSSWQFIWFIGLKLHSRVCFSHHWSKEALQKQWLQFIVLARARSRISFICHLLFVISHFYFHLLPVDVFQIATVLQTIKEQSIFLFLCNNTCFIEDVITGLSWYAKTIYLVFSQFMYCSNTRVLLFHHRLAGTDLMQSYTMMFVY